MDHALAINEFQFMKNVGLHHFALEVASESTLDEISSTVSDYPGVNVEFMPEPVGGGPRKHMICNEPGGIRIEFIWSGN